MVLFEWDEAKAKSNKRNHGVSFDDAILVFADPFALVEQDRVEDGETPLANTRPGSRRRAFARSPHRP